MLPIWRSPMRAPPLPERGNWTEPGVRLGIELRGLPEYDGRDVDGREVVGRPTDPKDGVLRRIG